jgi:hypothetical protein
MRTSNFKNHFCLRRVKNEKKHAIDGKNWIIPEVGNSKLFLYVPIQLYESLHKLANMQQPVLFFNFPAEYPMKPPVVTYHGINIQEIFGTNSIFGNDMSKISDIECLCCGSIMCRNKWTIAHGVQQIVDEFIKITTWKARVVERLYCKKIQHQLVKSDNSYLAVTDYPIFEYL